MYVHNGYAGIDSLRKTKKARWKTF